MFMAFLNFLFYKHSCACLLLIYDCLFVLYLYSSLDLSGEGVRGFLFLNKPNTNDIDSRPCSHLKY